MRGADDGYHKAHQDAQQDGEEGDLHRDQEAVGQVFPAAFLHEVDVKGVLQVQPHVFQPVPPGGVFTGSRGGLDLHGRVRGSYFLQPAGGFQVRNGAVDVLEKFRISLADGNGIGF